jgi:hypothetical protein
MPNPPPAPPALCGVGAESPKVWANARTACPAVLAGSGAPHQDRKIAIIFPERTLICILERCVGQFMKYKTRCLKKDIAASWINLLHMSQALPKNDCA